MRIAVFHNFIDNIGGSEIVALTLARELNADLYTTNIDANKISRMGFSDILPRIKSIGKLPKNAPFRQQIALWRFRKLNLGNKYDFYIISGDWAMSGVVNNHPNLWYTHSPLNELWQFKDYIKQEVLSWWKRPLYEVWVWFNRKLTLNYAGHVDGWVCNSKNTQDRIKKFYNKDAEIIYPPVDTSKFYYLPAKNYWLSVNRLITHKRIELQLKAFSKLPGEKLIIVGSYEKGARQFESYKKYIENLKTDNVEIINWASDEQLVKLYAECKGFITTAKDEDFGMTPVEAMASGKPVIAPDEGGYNETVVNGKTGILLDDVNPGKLIDAIKQISKEIHNNPEKYKTICQNRAKLFDKYIFVERIVRKMDKKENQVLFFRNS